MNGKKSTKSEWFGAVLHTKQNEVYVLPTLQECEKHFVFDRMGGIEGISEDAQKTIANIKLDHATLTQKRKGKIAGFLPDDLSLEDAQALYSHLTDSNTDTLPEFSFAIKQILENEYAIGVSKKSPQFGNAKGEIEISDDFNAPLEEFQDYS